MLWFGYLNQVNKPNGHPTSTFLHALCLCYVYNGLTVQTQQSTKQIVGILTFNTFCYILHSKVLNMTCPVTTE